MSDKPARHLPLPKPFPWKRDDPLARVKTVPGIWAGETAAANRALQDYARMGARRSLHRLQAVYEKTAKDPLNQAPPTVTFGALATWSANFAWQARVDAWDIIQEGILEREYQARRLEIAEADYAQGVAMRTLADKMLEEAGRFIKTTTRRFKDPDTGEWTILKTLAIDANLLVKLAEVGSKMSRLAVGLEQERKRLDITPDMIESLPDAILEAIAAGKITEEELVEMILSGESSEGEE